jgi:hypothetical protein
MKKYKLTKTKIIGMRVLKRLEALRDFGDVKKGDLGGWIIDESNLSHEGNCWVYDESTVFLARLEGDIKVKDNSFIVGPYLLTGKGELSKCIVLNYSSYINFFNMDNKKIVTINDITKNIDLDFSNKNRKINFLKFIQAKDSEYIDLFDLNDTQNPHTKP